MRFFNLIFLLFFFNGLFAQNNIVLNGIFIDTISCPPSISYSNYSYEKNWYSFTSPDFFNECSKEINANGSVNIPNNQRGFQKSISGDAYVGFFFCAPYTNKREYITGKFKRPLSKDSTYQISFFISTADNSKYAIDRIGAYLSKDSVFQKMI